MLNTEPRQDFEQKIQQENSEIVTKEHCENSVTDKINPYECELCDKTFSQEKYVKQHLKTVHEGINPFNCQTCQKSFTRKHNLDYHIAATHEVNLKLFQCPKCEKQFQFKDALNKHVKTVIYA